MTTLLEQAWREWARGYGSVLSAREGTETMTKRIYLCKNKLCKWYGLPVPLEHVTRLNLCDRK